MGSKGPLKCAGCAVKLIVGTSMHTEAYKISREVSMCRAYLFKLHILALGELLVAAPITAIAVALFMSTQISQPSSHNNTVSSTLPEHAVNSRLSCGSCSSCAQSRGTCGM